MKKTVFVFLPAFCLLLSGCGKTDDDGYTLGEFFSDTLLQEGKISALPRPDTDVYGINADATGQTLGFACDREGFEQYVRELVSYLQGNREICYFGEMVTHPSMLILLPDYYIAPIEDGFDYTKDEYIFLYSLDGKLKEGPNGKPQADGSSCIKLILLFGNYTVFSDFDAGITIETNPASAYLEDGMEGELHIRYWR